MPCIGKSNLFQGLGSQRFIRRKSCRRFRPRFEILEDRLALAADTDFEGAFADVSVTVTHGPGAVASRRRGDLLLHAAQRRPRRRQPSPQSRITCRTILTSSTSALVRTVGLNRRLQHGGTVYRCTGAGGGSHRLLVADHAGHCRGRIQPQRGRLAHHHRHPHRDIDPQTANNKATDMGEVTDLQTTFVWSGESTTSDHWSDPDNWVGKSPAAFRRFAIFTHNWIRPRPVAIDERFSRRLRVQLADAGGRRLQPERQCVVLGDGGFIVNGGNQTVTSTRAKGRRGLRECFCRNRRLADRRRSHQRRRRTW